MKKSGKIKSENKKERERGVGKEEKGMGCPPLSTERIMVFLDEDDAVEFRECIQVIHLDHVNRNRVQHVFYVKGSLDGVS